MESLRPTSYSSSSNPFREHPSGRSRTVPSPWRGERWCSVLPAVRINGHREVQGINLSLLEHGKGNFKFAPRRLDLRLSEMKFRQAFLSIHWSKKRQSNPSDTIFQKPF